MCPEGARGEHEQPDPCPDTPVARVPAPLQGAPTGGTPVPGASPQASSLCPFRASLRLAPALPPGQIPLKETEMRPALLRSLDGQKRLDNAGCFAHIRRLRPARPVAGWVRVAASRGPFVMPLRGPARRFQRVRRRAGHEHPREESPCRTQEGATVPVTKGAPVRIRISSSRASALAPVARLLNCLTGSARLAASTKTAPTSLR